MMQGSHSHSYDEEFFFMSNPVPMGILDLSLVEGFFTLLSPGDQVQKEIETLQNLVIPPSLIQSVNTAFLALFEAESIKELRRSISAIIPLDAMPALLRLTESLRKGSLYHQEKVTSRTLKGESLYLKLNLTVHREDTNLSRVLITLENQTNTSELREQLSLLSLLPETNPNIVIVMKCINNIYYVNPAGRKWLRLNEGEDSSQNSLDIEKLRALLPKDFGTSQCLVCDHHSERVFNITQKDKKFHVQINPMPGADHCMIVASDITDIDNLRKEREVFYHAFESSTNPIVITDTEGRIEYINSAFTSFYGYSQEEAKGQTPNILNPGRHVYFDEGYSPEAYDAHFRALWTSLDNLGYFEGVMINQCREKNIYFVKLSINSLLIPETGEKKYVAVAVDIDAMRRNERKIQLEMLHAISRVGELRDNETGNHMVRVGLYAAALAGKIGKSRRYCEDIKVYAPLHDIGKVGISDNILLAPRRLTEEEFLIIKSHPLVGHQILEEKKSLDMPDKIAFCHHEKWDGTGYPRGLQGDAIPMEARLTAIADVYDALRSRRPYKEPWSHERTVQQITAGKNIHFDPSLIDTFQEINELFHDIFIEFGD